MADIGDLAGRRVNVNDLYDFSLQVMLLAGLKEEHAQVTADVLVTTDTWGVHTHGTKQLRPLVKNVRAGRLQAHAEPEVVAEGAGWALVDGHYAMPMVSSCLAMRTAMAKARDVGIAYAGVRHSSHFGAAGYYAVMGAQDGLLGMAMCNVDPCMTVPGARGRVLGTNPFAYAIPAGKGRPLFLDIATSAAAASKIFAAASVGKQIPEGWLVDDDGLPTVDPSIFPRSGALLPMAGHKGYGLALLIEVLAGVLTGAAITQEIKSWLDDVPDPTNEGHAFIAIDIAAIIDPAEFAERMNHLANEIHSAPKAKGAERIYLPGEMEWERREMALTHGVVLPPDVVESLLGVAADVGLDRTSLALQELA